MKPLILCHKTSQGQIHEREVGCVPHPTGNITFLVSLTKQLNWQELGQHKQSNQIKFDELGWLEFGC